MQNALNIGKLILLLSLSTSYFVGLGWLAVGPLINRSFINKRVKISLQYEIPLLIISGLIINYGLILLLHSLKTTMIIGGTLACIGLALYVGPWIRYREKRSLSEASITKLAGTVFVCFLFLIPILVKPLTDWDSRSIWFFRAKMIYSQGSFDKYIGWQDPAALSFTHVDYPNLVPTLAAQVAHVMGFWNEYLPKISLFFVLLPAVVMLFSFFRKRSFSFVILIILLLFSYPPLLWNGYMDGYLALYFALSMLFLGRYYRNSQYTNLLLSIYCLIILLYFKNEGILAFTAGIVAMGFVVYLKKQALSMRTILIQNWGFVVLLVLMVFPFLLWNYYKEQWGIVNELRLGSSASITQLFKRIKEGSGIYVFKEVINQLRFVVMILSLTYIPLFTWKKHVPKEVIPALIAAVIYCIGMVAVYLMTPHDLKWQINNSINRTMLSVICCLYVVVYFVIDKLENDEVGFDAKGT